MDVTASHPHHSPCSLLSQPLELRTTIVPFNYTDGAPFLLCRSSQVLRLIHKFSHDCYQIDLTRNDVIMLPMLDRFMLKLSQVSYSERRQSHPVLKFCLVICSMAGCWGVLLNISNMYSAHGGADTSFSPTCPQNQPTYTPHPGLCVCRIKETETSFRQLKPSFLFFFPESLQ